MVIRSYFIVNAIGRSGGLAICRSNEMNVHLLSCSSNHIAISVESGLTPSPWTFIGFYGEPKLENRWRSWVLLDQLLLILHLINQNSVLRKPRIYQFERWWTNHSMLYRLVHQFLQATASSSFKFSLQFLSQLLNTYIIREKLFVITLRGTLCYFKTIWNKL